jgi:hypothetical protein
LQRTGSGAQQQQQQHGQWLASQGSVPSIGDAAAGSSGQELADFRRHPTD